jgi:deazaflavin-dependent oxidoreductase (nitroreductase family)
VGLPRADALQEIERLRSEVEELRASRMRVALASDEERRSIENELHNGVQQELIGLATTLDRVVALVEADPVAAKGLLADLPHEADPNVIYVFATRGGAPVNPDWYYNLTADGAGIVKRGTETYDVTVRDVTGEERDRIYAEQAGRYPGFAEYERQTEGIRTIPVLEFRRA